MSQLAATTRRLARSHATWVLLALTIAAVQAGFWLGAAWDEAFVPTDLTALASIAVNTVAPLCPAFGAGLGAVALPRASEAGADPGGIIPRTVVAVAAIGAIVLVAFASLGVSAGVLVLGGLGPEGQEAVVEHTWAGSAERLGWMLAGATPYAVLGAVLVAATGRRWLGGALAGAWALGENFVLGLITPEVWERPFVHGVAPGHVYYPIVWGEEGLYAMRNILGLEDATQAVLVFSAWTVVLGAIEWRLRRRRKVAAAGE